MSSSPYAACRVCNAYIERRARIVAPVLAVRALNAGSDPYVVTDEYMCRVHARHLAGGCLSTRVYTPPTGSLLHVHRHCNGCGGDVGDVRDDELDAAVIGAPLPDVRLECGCLEAAA